MRALDLIVGGVLLFGVNCTINQEIKHIINPPSQEEKDKCKLDSFVEECQELINEKEYFLLETAIKSNQSNDLRIKRFLAIAYGGLGRFEELVDLIDKIKSEDPDYNILELECNISSPEFNYGFGLALFKKNRFKEALPYLEIAERKYSKDEILLRSIARCNLETNNHDKFEDYCFKLLDPSIDCNKEFYAGLLANFYLSKNKLPQLLPKVQSQSGLDNQIVRNVFLGQMALAINNRGLNNLFNNKKLSSDLETANILYEIAEYMRDISPKQNYPFVMKLACLAYSIEFNLRFDNSRTLDEQKDLEKTAEKLRRIYQFLIDNKVPLKPLHDLYQINIIEFDLVNTASSSRNLGRACENLESKD